MKPPAKLVTVALPVYKRFDFLPQAIQSVAAQDYPNIELFVSDNGLNGERVPEIVRQNYPRPFRFRQNPATVPVVPHFNQLLREATGEYFILLCDDDELSPNYISELVRVLESDSQISAAISRQEVIDLAGHILRTSSEKISEQMTGDEFIEMWCSHEHRCKTWVTFLGRTQELRDCGGTPEFPTGAHSDDALIVKMCLGRQVAFSQRCTFRNRAYDESGGYSSSWRNLAIDTKLFLQFLNDDPVVQAYAKAQPERWARSRQFLIQMTWVTYFDRWETIYRQRLSTWEWLRAAVGLPFLPAYYRAVAGAVFRGGKAAAMRPIKRSFPGVYKKYRAAR